MPQTLIKNADFFVAALSQTFVSALQLDPDGMYSQVGFGIVEKFSEEYVRLKDSTAPSRTMTGILRSFSITRPNAPHISFILISPFQGNSPAFSRFSIESRVPKSSQQVRLPVNGLRRR